MTTEKLLDKLAKLQRMAEGAKAIGSEKEAQAFAEMVQKLLLEHDLSMSDIEFEKMEAEEPVGEHYVNYAVHDVKVSKTRVAWMERLAAMVARTHFCRIVVYSGTNNFLLVGREDHRKVAEYMIVTLTRAIINISKKEHAAYSWECYKKDGSTRQARGFKDAFITGFLFRLFQRLEEQKRAAGDTTSTALVRINREDAAVEAEMKRKKEAKETSTATGLRITRPSNSEGIRRGQKAADNINLGGKAVTGEATRRKELA